MRKSHSTKNWNKGKNKTPKVKPTLEESVPILPSINQAKNVVASSTIHADNVSIGDSNISSITNIVNIYNTPYLFDFTKGVSTEPIPKVYVDRTLGENHWDSISLDDILGIGAKEDITKDDRSDNWHFRNKRNDDINESAQEMFGKPQTEDVKIEIGKRILIQGGAGSGKTFHLENYCKKLNEQEEFVAIFRKFKELYLGNQYVVNLNPNKKCLLILDGLDEVSMPDAEKLILQIVRDFPPLNIIVSCRATHYVSKGNSIFRNFDENVLGDFRYEEMRQYISKRLEGNVDNFWEKGWQKGFFNWSYSRHNPFIIKSLCDYFEDNNQSIDELEKVYEFIIDKALKVRKEDKGNIDLIAEEERKHIKSNLEKLAFVLALCNQNSIKKDDFKTIFQDSAQIEDLLGASSILECINGHWTFRDLKIQDYLAAKTLAKAKTFHDLKKIIATSDNKLKNNWKNVVAFFYSIKNVNSNLKKKLLDWLEENNLDVLIGLESDLLDADTRFSIFTNFVEKCRKKNKEPYELFGGGLWNLEIFVHENEKVLNWICDELKNENRLSILFLFGYILNDNNKNKFSDNYQQAIKSKFLPFFEERTCEKDIHVFAEALWICESIITREEWVKVCNCLFVENSSQSRDTAYKIILKIELQNELVEHLIAPFLNKFQKKENDILDMSEEESLRSCISSISKEEVISILINQFEDENNLRSMEFADKLLPLILNAFANIVDRSNELHCRMIDLIVKNLYFFDVKENLQERLKELNLLDDIIIKAVLEEKYLYLIGRFYHSHFKSINANDIKTIFEKSKPEEKVWTNLLGWINMQDNDKAQELSKLFNIPIPSPIVQVSSEFERAILFDKAASMQEVKKIINDLRLIYGKDIIEKEDNKVIQEEGLYLKYTHFNLWTIVSKDHINLNSIYKELERNWEWRSINGIKDKIKNDKLELSNSEITFVRQWCDNYIYKVHKGKNQETNGLWVFTFFVITFNWLDYSKEIYEMLLRLVSIKVNDVSVLQFVHKNELLDKEKITSIVVGFVQLNNRPHDLLEGDILYLYHVKEKNGLPCILDLLKNNIYNYWVTAFKIAIKFGASNDELFDIWEHIPLESEYREIHLFDYLFEKDPNRTKEFLKNRLIQENRKKTALMLLLRAGDLYALEQLNTYYETGDSSAKLNYDYHSNTQFWEYKQPESISLLVNILLFSFEENEDKREPISFRRSNHSFAYNSLLNLSLVDNPNNYKLIVNELDKKRNLCKRLILISKISYLKTQINKKHLWFNINSLANIEKFKGELTYHATQNRVYTMYEGISYYDLITKGIDLKKIGATFEGEHKIGFPIIPGFWTYHISSKTNLKDYFGNMWKEFKNGERFRKHK